MKKVSTNSRKDRIIYALFAIYYCLNLAYVYLDNCITRLVLFTISLIKYFLPAKARKKFQERQALVYQHTITYPPNKKNGYRIDSHADRLYLGLLLALPTCIGFSLYGIILKIYGAEQRTVIYMLVILSITTALAYIPIENNISYEERRRKYFKIFEKEDGQWLKKWKIRTIVFCFASLLIYIIGLLSMFAIAISN